MKKIKVTTTSPFFRQEQFDTELRDGREMPVMVITKEEYLDESFMFSLYSRELEALPCVKSEKNRKYLCVTDSFYIIVERGEKGFETSFHYFSAEIKTKNGEISVTINALDDEELTAAIYDKFVENEFSGADSFNERQMSSAHYTSLAQLKMVEATEFLRLPYKGNLKKIPAMLGSLHSGKLRLRHNSDYKYVDTGMTVMGNVEAGVLIYKRDADVSNMVEIVRLQSYAHDFNGDFWAVAETVYSYPADVAQIKAEYPEFYERECASDAVIEKQVLLERVKDLPYIREEYKIGDGIIYIPVDTTTAEISIPVGEFHFVAERRGYGHLTRKNKGRLRLNGLPLLCSLVEINRRFKLLYYRTCGFVKCDGKYYAELKFERQSFFFDSLDADLLNFREMDFDTRTLDKASLACAGYLMFRDMIKPVVIDKDDAGGNITEE